MVVLGAVLAAAKAGEKIVASGVSVTEGDVVAKTGVEVEVAAELLAVAKAGETIVVSVIEDDVVAKAGVKVEVAAVLWKVGPEIIPVARGEIAGKAVSVTGGEVVVEAEAIFGAVVVVAGPNSGEMMDSSLGAVLREFDPSLNLKLRTGERVLFIVFPMPKTVDGKKPDSLSSKFVSKDVFVVKDIGL